jgi:predicted MFS family arabinose efflux permease
MLVMVIYGLGAAFASVLVGTLADIFSIRRLGYGVMIFSSFVLCMMYFALGIKYFYTTFLLYMFLGMATFSLYTWLVCACSKIYGGKFEIFAVNMQVMGLAFTSYTAANILFGGVVKINLILGIQLAWLIIGCVTSICFVRRLPLGPIDIEFEESAPETSRSQPPSPAPDASID